jgi:hypothetical protein
VGIASLALLVVQTVLLVITLAVTARAVRAADETVQSGKDAASALAIATDLLQRTFEVAERTASGHERERRREQLHRIGELAEALQAHAQAIQADHPAGDTSWRVPLLNDLIRSGIGLSEALPALATLRTAHSPDEVIAPCARLRDQVENALHLAQGVGPTE